ncbi:MAG TPA: hypothetical protein VFV72_05085 [Candidatus Limnocylindrales bacterium]|nr:hypothetical protein [Candidatus Limnocylindrales bacterium]
MNASLSPREDRGRGLALLGAVALVLGVIAFALEQLSVDVASWLGGSGWTLFIIVPGVVLLVASIVLDEDPAKATSIAGAVVTTVGLLLLYQDQTAHYESWAYAWTLIPAAVGLALVANGLRFHRADHVSVGVRLAAAFGVLFVAGIWYFETIFRTNEAPFDLAENWPVALIILGGVLLVLGLLRGMSRGADDTA